MAKGRTFAFGFDEQHNDDTASPEPACPDCGAPLQATRLETECLDCELVVASERGDGLTRGK